MKIANFFSKIFELFKNSRKSKNSKSPSKDALQPFLKIWKKFIRQIPREFRSVLKSHKHFILLGDEHAGKSELIKGIIEQSQSIYPFEIEFTDYESLQFYLGPKQIIHELSLDVVKNRTIQLRRSMIQLWKRLFIKESPIVVIAYNPFQETNVNVEHANKTARLFSGKLSLLSELSKGSLSLKITLTHLDKLEGYIEFAHFLKKHNISFMIPLTSNFESDALSDSLGRFRDQYLSLILTTCSSIEYSKILKFFDELPKLFPAIEEFLRTLISGSTKNKVKLEYITFSSNLESHSSYVSFDWSRTTSNSIFYRHPMLKHQIAAASILVLCFGLIFNNFYNDRYQVKLANEGIDSLIFQPPKIFISELVPQIEKTNSFLPNKLYLPLLPKFYYKQLQDHKQSLALRIRKHILEPELCKLLLTNDSELQILYMTGLLHATRNNRIGKHILKNLSDWSQKLDLNAQLIHCYIQSSYIFDNTSVEIDYIETISASTPLSDPTPWLTFLTHFKELEEQPIFTGHNFTDLHENASSLLHHLKIMKTDPHAYAISNLLKEMTSNMLTSFDKNIKVLKWLNENNDQLETFLMFVYHSSPEIPDISNLNVSQLFAKLKEIADMTKRENRSFRFVFNNQDFSYETKNWVSTAATHMIERLIHNYILANNDTHGNIFFRNTPPLTELIFESYRNEFPNFSKPIIIDGRFTRMAFEKNVRNTAESLLKLLDELPINEEDKDRFIKFIQQELISYATEYQENFERLYAASDIRSSSIEETKQILEKILLPSSFFEHFLNQINHHTEVFSIPTSSVSVLSEINHFDFLKALFGHDKTKLSPFESYQSIIKQALAQLNHQIGPTRTIHILDEHLTPAASIALSILRNDPNSYTNQITSTLTESGVPSHYHFIFLAPIEQIYKIGISELKKGINQLWKESLAIKITSFLNKRPFNPSAEIATTYEEVEQMTNPNSQLYKMINEIILPASVHVDGKWQPDLSSDLQLIDQMYVLVNRLVKINHILWDSEGNPKPINLKIKSCPFEAKPKTFPAPIVSYLVTGEETFHNFNQSPTWHDLKIVWWKANNSTVVVELTNQKDSRSYRDEKVTNTLWSFFELLNKGHQEKENIWRWELANQFGDDVSKIALQFNADPWKLFEITE